MQKCIISEEIAEFLEK